MTSHIFESSVQKSLSWLKLIQEELGWEDKQKVYNATRAVLHTLRDRMAPEEAVQFAAQLPMVLKGVYFDEYKLGSKPDKEIKTKEDFYSAVQEKADLPFNSNEAVQAVTNVLRQKVSDGEIEDILGGLPQNLRAVLR